MVKSKYIFYGKPKSGKTNIVNQLSSGYKNIVKINYSLFESNSTWIFGDVTENTELIIVDDIKNIGKVINFFIGKFLVIEKPLEKQKVLPCPKVVLICESIKGFVIDKRKFNVLHVK